MQENDAQEQAKRLARQIVRKVRYLKNKQEEVREQEDQGNQESADWILVTQVAPVLAEVTTCADELRTLEAKTASPPKALDIQEFADRYGVSVEEIERCLELQQLVASYRQLAIDDSMANPMVDQSPSRLKKLLPAVIRICAATVIGALVGAPIGAFLVKENVVHEMVKTAVATGIGTAGLEIVNPLSEKAGAFSLTTSRNISHRNDPDVSNAGSDAASMAVDTMKEQPDSSHLAEQTASPHPRNRPRPAREAADILALVLDQAQPTRVDTTSITPYTLSVDDLAKRPPAYDDSAKLNKPPSHDPVNETPDGPVDPLSPGFGR